jgi:hypothetical protein
MRAQRLLTVDKVSRDAYWLAGLPECWVMKAQHLENLATSRRG